MIIPEIDLSRVLVKQPKRYDTFMSGKVVYDDEKLIVDLPGVRLISCKDMSNTAYVRFKLTKDQERFILDLEERLTEHTTLHIDSWFKSKMNRETVDEYFQSSLNFHRKLRCIMKIRIENPTCVPEMALEGKHVDVKLRVASLKFLKSAFWICYDVIECVASRAVLFQGDDDDDTASLAGLGDESELPGPDHEEVERLRNMYIGKLDAEITEGEERLQKMAALREVLRANNFVLATFDAVENAIA